jgi:5-methyltetrahydrofolate--homocysteine methyltransferase
MAALDEVCLAVCVARENIECEVVCTFTFEKTVNGDYRTMMGVTPSDMAIALTLAGASIIGANCGNGIEGMIDIVREIRKVDSKTPVLVHANAGRPVLEGGKTVFPETPEMMAEKVSLLIKAGANIIGGCCGTTPQHIRALAQAIEIC